MYEKLNKFYCINIMDGKLIVKIFIGFVAIALIYLYLTRKSTEPYYGAPLNKFYDVMDAEKMGSIGDDTLSGFPFYNAY